MPLRFADGGFFNRRQLEPEDIPRAVVLDPRVQELEKAVVRPNPGAELLVHLYELRTAFPLLCELGSLVKLAVLGQGARRGSFGLVDCLGIDTSADPRPVVALIY